MTTIERFHEIKATTPIIPRTGNDPAEWAAAQMRANGAHLEANLTPEEIDELTGGAVAWEPG